MDQKYYLDSCICIADIIDVLTCQRLEEHPKAERIYEGKEPKIFRREYKKTLKMVLKSIRRLSK